ncbi:MAG TPA: PKD domain-containing protein, partial [Ktedonobacteraceae bacterium]|nr:PKD domain-containing protein [Ktedonobacteraceae bacterium]
AGLPAATFLGNFSYYDKNPPPWSYPYDQRQDTIQLMNTFANGSSQKAPALVLSLALPGMLTTWMLHQPDILGEVDATSRAAQNVRIAAISDIGQTQVGKGLTLNVEVNGDSSAYSYAWNFGDGSTASGLTASHTYAAAGNYMLSLTVKGSSGSRQVLKAIHVVQHTTVYPNPYAAFPSDGNPPSNPQVILPGVNSPTSGTPPSKTPLSRGVPVGWFIGLGLLIVLVAGGVLFFVFRRKKVV